MFGMSKMISSDDIVEMRRRAVKADVEKAKVSTKRQRKVESVVPTHGADVEAHRMMVGYSAPHPGKAPVAQMRWMPLATLGGVVMRD